MKHGLRVAAAFTVAPLLPILALAVLIAPTTRNFPAYVLVVAVVAYAIAVVLGVPALLWMRHSGFSLRRVLVASFLIGFLPVLLMTAMTATSTNPLWQWLLLPGVIGALSAAGGAIFWLLARPALIRPGHEA